MTLCLMWHFLNIFPILAELFYALTLLQIFITMSSKMQNIDIEITLARRLPENPQIFFKIIFVYINVKESEEEGVQPDQDLNGNCTNFHLIIFNFLSDSLISDLMVLSSIIDLSLNVKNA